MDSVHTASKTLLSKWTRTRKNNIIISKGTFKDTKRNEEYIEPEELGVVWMGPEADRKERENQNQLE